MSGLARLELGPELSRTKEKWMLDMRRRRILYSIARAREASGTGQRRDIRHQPTVIPRPFDDHLARMFGFTTLDFQQFLLLYWTNQEEVNHNRTNIKRILKTRKTSIADTNDTPLYDISGVRRSSCPLLLKHHYFHHYE